MTSTAPNFSAANASVLGFFLSIRVSSSGSALALKVRAGAAEASSAAKECVRPMAQRWGSAPAPAPRPNSSLPREMMNGKLGFLRPTVPGPGGAEALLAAAAGHDVCSMLSGILQGRPIVICAEIVALRRLWGQHRAIPRAVDPIHAQPSGARPQTHHTAR